MMAAEAKAVGGGRAAGIRAARDVFYRGEVARRIAEYHAREGGLLALEDLAGFEVEVGPALMTSYRDYQIAACGFWCQGPVLLQMFNLVEGYDLRALGHNSPRYAHVLAECMKLAFADREAYYGDPAHVKVPADGLLSKVYAQARRTLVREDRAWPDMPPPGDPMGLARLKNGRGRGHSRRRPVGPPRHRLCGRDRRRGQRFLRDPERSVGGFPHRARGRLRGVPARLAGLAHARTSERGGARQAAAADARACARHSATAGCSWRSERRAGMSSSRPCSRSS